MAIVILISYVLEAIRLRERMQPPTLQPYTMVAILPPPKPLENNEQSESWDRTVLNLSLISYQWC